MRYLAPAARNEPQQCERMAQVFAQQHWTTRQAADFYNAWRNAKGLDRERILAEPELFLKVRHQPQPVKTRLEGDSIRSSPSPAGHWSAPKSRR